MKIEKLWTGLDYPKCDNCEQECKGHLDYKNLCSNVNYLREYGEKNLNKNKESFGELKKVIGDAKPSIFSFGCGIGLDCIAAKEVFGDNIKYYGIEKCNWAIKKTENCQNFEPVLPQTFNYVDGLFLLTSVSSNDVVLCFFNSLYSISQNERNLCEQFVKALQNKKSFYILCDYTVNSTYHIPRLENDLIECILKKLSPKFTFKRLPILDGKGTIVVATR